ncbi:MAG: hypothetical protein AAEI08_04050 [Gammaproteobacteria bacterium]
MVAVAVTSHEALEITNWIRDVFGFTFILLLGILVFTTLYCWTNLQLVESTETGAQKVWLETGLHAANGVATLALTYTLLGVSLGISILANQELTPSTIHEVIRELTEQFSVAFLTTVVGLPISAILRALLMITDSRLQAKHAIVYGDGNRS